MTRSDRIERFVTALRQGRSPLLSDALAAAEELEQRRGGEPAMMPRRQVGLADRNRAVAELADAIAPGLPHRAAARMMLDAAQHRDQLPTAARELLGRIESTGGLPSTDRMLGDIIKPEWYRNR